MKKRIPSMLLTIVMIFSIMSVNVFAAEGDVAQIGEQGYATLEAAIAAVEDGETIKLLADCDESVTITQQKNVSFTIDGDDHTYTGTINVNGGGTNGSLVGAGETLTIKNVNFVAATYGQSSIACVKKSAVHNLTVDGCSFTGTDEAYKFCYGIYLHHAYNIIVKDTEGTGLYDLVYGNTAVTGFTAEGVTVTDSTNGIWLSYVNSTADFDDVDLAVDEVGLGFLNNAGGTITIDNAEIDASSAVYLGQKNTTTTVEVIVNKLEGNADLMVEVDSADAKYDITMNDVSLKENTDGDYVVKEPVYISNAEELTAFAEKVDNGDTFAGVTVYLTDDIDLENELLNPIGSYRNETAFKGTFDGQGYAIKNLSQNTWDLDNGYYYNDCGLGLFGLVEDATIKNLTIDGAEISGESAICGTVAAAGHNTVFENITIQNANVADYQYYAGGIVGWASGDMEFVDCYVAPSTTIAAQWGDFDNSTGGVIGGASSSAVILMKDCEVACRLDVYNDVTSSYQWYAYRRCGMLIGNPGQTEKIGDTTYAAAPQLTAEDVTVVYGDWADYHYCEFAGTNWPYVRVEAGISNSAYSNPRYGHPTDANGNEVVDGFHVHNEDEDHMIICQFDQLYGGGQGVYGTNAHDGVTVEYAEEKNHSLQAMVDAAEDGGTIVLTEDLCEVCVALVNKNITVTVEDGIVFPLDTDDLFMVVGEGNVSIVGGTYAHKPDNYVADGYKAFDLQNGTWVVKPADATVTVTFNSNGETVQTQEIPYASTAAAVDVSRSGYTFKGWYSDSDFTTEFSFDTPITEDTTVYAKWSKKSSGGSGSSSYTITVEDTKNGDVTVSASRASSGTTVTITVTPDSGYDLDELVVLDKNGKEIEVTKKSNGKHTFKMPSGKVSIEAVFVEAKPFENPFADVSENDYYYDAVLWAAKNCITGGSSATTFSPDVTCTRAQTVTFLWRVAGSPEPETTVCPFDDVTPDQYYYDAVLWAFENGITAGSSATTFSPDVIVTRAQTATFLWKWAKAPTVKAGNPFSDVASDAYYHDAVVWAADEDITAGTSETTFSPDAPCLRGQIVTFLYRFLAE